MHSFGGVFLFQNPFKLYLTRKSAVIKISFGREKVAPHHYTSMTHDIFGNQSDVCKILQTTATDETNIHLCKSCFTLKTLNNWNSLKKKTKEKTEPTALPDYAHNIIWPEVTPCCVYD